MSLMFPAIYSINLGLIRLIQPWYLRVKLKNEKCHTVPFQNNPLCMPFLANMADFYCKANFCYWSSINIISISLLCSFSLSLSPPHMMLLPMVTTWHCTGVTLSFLQALLVEQGLTVCWFCVGLWVWDNFSASDWLKIGDIARHCTT